MEIIDIHSVILDPKSMVLAKWVDDSTGTDYECEKEMTVEEARERIKRVPAAAPFVRGSFGYTFYTI